MFGTSIPPHLGVGRILAARWTQRISNDIGVRHPGHSTLIDLLRRNDRNIVNQLGGAPEAVAGGRVKIAFERGFRSVSRGRAERLLPAPWPNAVETWFGQGRQIPVWPSSRARAQQRPGGSCTSVGRPCICGTAVIAPKVSTVDGPPAVGPTHGPAPESDRTHPVSDDRTCTPRSESVSLRPSSSPDWGGRALLREAPVDFAGLVELREYVRALSLGPPAGPRVRHVLQPVDPA